MKKRDPDPKTMPDRALVCAVNACGDSVWRSDREFARECSEELERRTCEQQVDTDVDATHSEVMQ